MTHRFDEEIVQAIARDAGILPDIVREVHVREWQRLEQEARIKDYLPLLVMKHVREHFLYKGTTGTAATPGMTDAHDDAHKNWNTERKAPSTTAAKTPLSPRENKTFNPAPSGQAARPASAASR
ncbi:MAG: DUF3562 domain-containing protein [bacterium]|nr:DUF3562 domain-containing protein [bacterium]